MNSQDAIQPNDLEPMDADDNDDFIEGSCPYCGAGPDEVCDMDCGDGDDNDNWDDETDSAGRVASPAGDDE